LYLLNELICLQTNEEPAVSAVNVASEWDSSMVYIAIWHKIILVFMVHVICIWYNYWMIACVIHFLSGCPILVLCNGDTTGAGCFAEGPKLSAKPLRSLAKPLPSAKSDRQRLFCRELFIGHSANLCREPDARQSAK
jgi:hypothetical protein